MAFITYPLNNIDYTAEDAELFHCTRTSGIWAEDSFPISVTGADNNVTIGTGIAWINNEEFSGKVAALKSAEVLDLGIADSTYPRIDVIAIQFNANNNATDVVIKKGTPATNPVRPSIVRTGAIYELYLASVYRPAGATAITASNITDLRMDETVCGLMADSVTKVDMTAIEAQVRNLINNLQNEIDSVRNLSGIMFESEWVEGDVIPVSKSGTGAKTAEEALANLGGISVKLLWINASPTSEFTEQDITIDMSEYDFIGVLVRDATTSALTKLFTTRNTVGDALHTAMPWTSTNTNTRITNRVRRITIASQNILRFGTGIFASHASAQTTDNASCIPLAIYGIKGVK